jgi:hypothetical protein
MTCGVKIKNHGLNEEFRNKVDSYQSILSKKFKIRKSREECSSNPESPIANIRTMDGNPFNSVQNMQRGNNFSFKV